jgi:hypothetical protein
MPVLNNKKLKSLTFRDDFKKKHAPMLDSIVRHHSKVKGEDITASEALRLCIRNEYTRINVKK